MSQGPYSPIYIVPGAVGVPVIKVYSDSGLTVLIDAIPKTNIGNIIPVYNPTPGAVYPFATLTRISLTLLDGSEFNFECQQVGNQASWDNGDQASLTAAVNDISASIP
jgi:hypothetical protein